MANLNDLIGGTKTTSDSDAALSAAKKALADQLKRGVISTEEYTRQSRAAARAHQRHNAALNASTAVAAANALSLRGVLKNLRTMTPRQLIAAVRGNVSNTGRHIGLGVAAGAMSLGFAASPMGAETLMAPLKQLAAVVGSLVLPAMMKFGAEIMNMADRERMAKKLPEKGVGDKFHDFMIGVNSTLAGVLAGMVTLSPTTGIATATATAAGLSHARQKKRLKDMERAEGKDPEKEAAKRNASNMQKLLTTMEMSIGGQASVGKAENAWARIQTGMVMTPFEKEMLDIMRENLQIARKEAAKANVAAQGN